MKSLHVLVRSGCGLCEDLVLQLEELSQQRGFDYTVTDIATSRELADNYSHLIPVVLLDDRLVCNYFLDPVAVQAALEEKQD